MMDISPLLGGKKPIILKIKQYLPAKRSEIFDFLIDYPSASPATTSNPYSDASPNSYISTSAESNRQPANVPLLRYEEYKFLEFYGKEVFEDLLNNEFKC